MSKYLVKVPKALVPEYRKKVVSILCAPEIEEEWLLKNGSSTRKFKEYIEKLESLTHDQKHLLGSLEDYRNKIKDLKFNLKHNGRNLFNYSPEDLIEVDLANEPSSLKKSNYEPLSKIIARSKSNKAEENYGDSDVPSIVDRFKKVVIPNVFGSSKATSMIHCRYCGPSAYVETFSKQTRGADEGETTFAECTTCGRKWRA
jgi:DNA-directed RNA polymerase subunit M/transcription elongation factor TFIIS